MRLSSTQFQQARPAMVSIPYRAVITNDGRVFLFPEQLASSLMMIGLSRISISTTASIFR
ncbi:MAG: hypothetical protein U0694_22985 [Anaerolineae bacterium]